MKINQDKFYKSQGFLWSIEIQFESIIKSVNEHDIGCHTEFCVTVYNKKVLNSVQPWPRSFSAMCHYTKFDMASDIDGPYCLNCCSDLVIAQNTSVRNKRTSTSDPMP